MRRFVLGMMLLAGAAGCQKNDTETLARIGRKLADRGQDSLGDIRSRIDLKWSPPTIEPSLEEKVRLRLRFEKDLADIPFEVKAKGAEVELKGKVPHPDHKRRALELAETTRGVEKVTDGLEVAPPKTAPAPVEPPVEEPPRIGPPQDVPPLPEGMESLEKKEEVFESGGRSR